MNRKIFTVLVFILSAPLLVMAQKAYETIPYSGKLNNLTIKLDLADGYINASEIKINTGKSKPIIYNPDFDSSDGDKKLKFTTKASTNYFILNNIEEAYDTPPTIVTGTWYTNGKQYAIKLRKL